MATVAEIRLEQAALNANNAGKVDADGEEYVPLAVDGDVGPLTMAARAFTPSSTDDGVPAGDIVPPAGDIVPPAGTNAEMLELQEQLKTALNDVETNRTLFQTTQATLGKVNSELAKSKGIQETSVKNSQDIIKDTLAFYGLPASLAAKLNAKLIGGESATGIAMSIRETDEYAARFPAMAQRRKLNLPAISEADYLDLERSYRQIGQAAKLPADFYDKPDDLI